MAIVPYASTYCTAYTYMNEEYGKQCILYLLEMHGQPPLISFSSSSGTTEYHGTVVQHQRRMLELRCNHRGPRHPLKHAMLLQSLGIIPRSYDGFDYRARHIVMQELKRWYWHFELELWIGL